TDHKLGFFKTWKNLRKERYEIVISFQMSIFPFIVRAKKRFNFLTKSLFSTRFFTHESVNFMKLIEPYFGSWKEKRLYFPITETDRQKAKNFFHSHNISSSTTIVAIHTGNPQMPDRWNAINYSTVCDTIIEEYNARIILFAEQNDPLIEKIVQYTQNRDKIIKISEITSPREIISILEKVNLAITRGGLFLHLACAAKSPVISIFGAGNPYRYGPIGTRYIIIHTDMECFPCNKKKKCEKHFECIETISYEKVVEAARLILDETKQLILFE
ncbi:MAG: glycosyltransferase family 9 protein, partial [Candidatus Omnitrophica bacterium]|nr:glycosyltransferase family 9 protein [Candidatus Omnitrophota bacterium]